MTTATGSPTRVALVDDHDLLALSLAEALRLDRDLDVVLVHDGGPDVLDALAGAAPDVILLDVDLGYTSGLELLPEIERRVSQAATVMLSGRQDAEQVALAFERGAAGYLSKSAGLAEVRSAVLAAAEGRTVLSRHRLTDVVQALTAEQEHVRRLGGYLTERERSILSRLAAGHQTARIAQDLQITHHTVRTHIQNILTKLGAHSKLEAAAIGVRGNLVSAFQEPVSR